MKQKLTIVKVMYSKSTVKFKISTKKNIKIGEWYTLYNLYMLFWRYGIKLKSRNPVFYIGSLLKSSTTNVYI